MWVLCFACRGFLVDKPENDLRSGVGISNTYILTPSVCPTILFDSGTNHLELAQVPQLKGSIPQDPLFWTPAAT